MSIGGYISAIGHVGILGWLAFGANVGDVPEPIDVTPVTVISAEDFAILTNNTAPDVVVSTATLGGAEAPETQPQFGSTQDNIFQPADAPVPTDAPQNLRRK